MPKVTLSLVRDILAPNEIRQIATPFTAAWPEAGQLLWRGEKLDLANGTLLEGPGPLSADDDGGTLLRFTVATTSDTALGPGTVLETRSVTADSSNVLLRLDSVTFPPGATAWRHVHPGPGFRFLLKGALRLESDDHVQDVAAGDCWFEDANSPVRATASTDHPETVFIRLMVLPLEYKGRRTIRILSEEDRNRERRQTTRTFFDAAVKL